MPYDPLSRVSRGTGFLNLRPDPDGIIRRLPLLVRYNGVIYPSLSLRVLCDYLNVSAQQVVVRPGNSITLEKYLMNNLARIMMDRLAKNIPTKME